MTKRIKRVWTIVVKDLKGTVRRLPMLLGVYGLYFFIAWFAVRELIGSVHSFEPARNFFWPLFLFQTALILTFMLLPQFVYSEAMTEKHEAYFAYGYSVMDIVLGKAMVIFTLSFVPAVLFSAVGFPALLPGGPELPVMLSAVSLCVFSLICMTVFFTWFSRIGRFAVVFLMLLMVIFFSKTPYIISMAAHASVFVVALVISGFGAFLFLVCVCSAWLGSREAFLLKR